MVSNCSFPLNETNKQDFNYMCFIVSRMLSDNMRELTLWKQKYLRIFQTAFLLNR